MIGLTLRTLRYHKGGFVASFIVLFVGATIVIGSGGLLETGIRNAAPPQRLAGAPIVVTGDQRYAGTERELVFPERIRIDAANVSRIAALPDVAATAPDVSFPATLNRIGGRAPGTKATGHGWSSTTPGHYRITEGAPPSTAGQVVLGERLAATAGLSPGDHVELLTRGNSERFEVTGLIAGPADRDTLFLGDDDAARLTGHPDLVDSIGVVPAPGADLERVTREIRASMSGLPIVVLTGDERGRAENPQVIAEGGDLIALAAGFGGLAAMVTVFVVAGTLSLSIHLRQRETALLRAVGATPGQVRRLIIRETMLLAVVATALACYPGIRCGSLLLDIFADNGVVPHAIAYRAGLVPVIAGAGTAVLTALTAGCIAARAAGRTRPTEALAEVALRRRRFSRVRLGLGLLCLAGGALLARGTAASDGPEAAGVATPAIMVWAAALALLGPPLATAITHALRRPIRVACGVAGELATDNARAGTTRLAAAAMPVMLATGLALGLIHLQSTQSEGAERAFMQSLRADLAVTSEAGGLPPDLVDTIARQPGVQAATARITTRVYLEPENTANADIDPEEGTPQPIELPAQGINPEGADLTTALRAVTGSLDALHGNTLVLPTRYAENHKIGDTVPLRLGDGTRITPTLVATIAARPGYESAVLPSSLLLDHTDTGTIPEILVAATPGTPPAELAATLSALAEQHPGLRVVDRRALAMAWEDGDNTQTTMAYLVLAVVGGYAVVSLINTQVLATSERRREFALLRLVGATRPQVLRMTGVEASLVAVTGMILGALIAAATLIPASLSVLDSFVPGGSPWIPLTVLATAFIVTVMTTLLSTLAALRSEPTTAYE